MPDCFISYSHSDLQLATFVHDELQTHGLSSFMASTSLQPGTPWTEAIWANLKASNWVIFLASKAACDSPYVQQELGMALGQSKLVVPVIWDIEPHELPGWTDRFQALNLTGATIDEIRNRVSEIAERVKAGKRNAAVVLGAIVLGVLLFGGSGE